MTVEEAIRTQAARQELSPRRTITKAYDALAESQSAIVFELSCADSLGSLRNLSPRSLHFAADQAQLAADLLRSLAERVK